MKPRFVEGLAGFLKTAHDLVAAAQHGPALRFSGFFSSLAARVETICSTSAWLGMLPCWAAGSRAAGLPARSKATAAAGQAQPRLIAVRGRRLVPRLRGLPSSATSSRTRRSSFVPGGGVVVRDRFRRPDPFQVGRLVTEDGGIDGARELVFPAAQQRPAQHGKGRGGGSPAAIRRRSCGVFRRSIGEEGFGGGLSAGGEAAANPAAARPGSGRYRRRAAIRAKGPNHSSQVVGLTGGR
jgi:hypothetical protein